MPRPLDLSYTHTRFHNRPRMKGHRLFLACRSDLFSMGLWGPELVPCCSISFFPLSSGRRAVQMPKSQIVYALHWNTKCKGMDRGWRYVHEAWGFNKVFLQQDIVLAGHQQIKQHEEYPDQFDSMIVPCHFGPTEGGHKLSMHRSNYAEDKYARSNYVVFGEQRHLSRKCKTANALIRWISMYFR